MAQRPHRLFPELTSSIRSDLIELRPQRHLRVSIITRKEKKSAVVTRYGVADNTASSTTVFMIHGVGGSIEVWRSQFDSILIPAVTKIIAVDLIGHGQSFAPRHQEAYQFREIASDVISLFTEFHSTNNIIIGHSYGYMVFLFCCYPCSFSN